MASFQGNRGFPESIQDYFPCVGRYGIFGPASFSASDNAALNATRSSQGYSVVPKTHRLLVSFSASHQGIARSRQANAKSNGFAAIGNTPEGFLLHPPSRAPHPPSRPESLPTTRSEGLQAVRMLTSAHCAATSAIIRRFSLSRRPAEPKMTITRPSVIFRIVSMATRNAFWGVGKIDDGGKGLAKVNPFHPPWNPRHGRKYHLQSLQHPAPVPGLPRPAPPGSSRR